VDRAPVATGENYPPLPTARCRSTDWDKVHQLSVRVDRLPLWHRARLLCIGDAVHTNVARRGVGINLAIQDAVATANFIGVGVRPEHITT
jgi:2-polyprenyl-6-methoxyphenol hydroxylase-like FAD-dependent oxidoreductase